MPHVGVINYLLKNTIEATADTSMAGNNYIYSDYCSPKFTDISFKYKGETYSGIQTSASLKRIADGNYSASGNTTWDCKSYIYFEIYFKEKDSALLWLSGNDHATYYGMSNTSMYPSYPESMDIDTKGAILSFDTAPTGSFLTWLNSNATLIPTS